MYCFSNLYLVNAYSITLFKWTTITFSIPHCVMLFVTSVLCQVNMDKQNTPIPQTISSTLFQAVERKLSMFSVCLLPPSTNVFFSPPTFISNICFVCTYVTCQEVLTRFQVFSKKVLYGNYILHCTWCNGIMHIKCNVKCS